MGLPEGFKPIRDLDAYNNYYFAYGSNLDRKRMAGRCPDSEEIGTATLPGYRLLFKKSATGFYATVEQDANCCVPLGVYRISLMDEMMLDRAEGCPRHYYKQDFLLPILKTSGKRMRKREGIAYILHENRVLGAPAESYFGLIWKAYGEWGFDRELLKKALSDSIGDAKAQKYISRFEKGWKGDDEDEE